MREWKYHYVVLHSLVLNNQKMPLALEIIIIYKIKDIKNKAFRIIIRPENHFNDKITY